MCAGAGKDAIGKVVDPEHRHPAVQRGRDDEVGAVRMKPGGLVHTESGDRIIVGPGEALPDPHPALLFVRQVEVPVVEGHAAGVQHRKARAKTGKTKKYRAVSSL